MKNIRAFIIYVVEEFKREFVVYFRYKSEFISTTLIFITFFVAIMSGVKSIAKDGQVNPLMIYNSYLYWIVAISALQDFPNRIVNECRLGTIEQLLITKYPIWLVLIIRNLAMLANTIIIVGVFSIGAKLIFARDIPIFISPIKLLNILVMIVGLYGFGFVFAGFALHWKKIASFLSLFQILILILGIGMNVSLYSFPWYKKLFPYTHVLQIEWLYFNKQLSIGNYGSFIMLSLLYVIIGIAAFTWLLKLSKIKGNLVHY